MMNRTTIDWPGLTHTINPASGCLRGCEYCCAKLIHNVRHKAYSRDPIKFYMFKRYENPFSVISYFPNVWRDIPKKSMFYRKVFVGSMSDICYWEKDFIKYTIDCCRIYPQWDFMFLTKDPSIYKKFKWPANCMLGVTITNQSETWKSDELAKMPNKTFISLEPIVGKIDFSFPGIDLIIVGAMTGKGKVIIEKEWLEEIKHENVHYKKSIKPEIIPTKYEKKKIPPKTFQNFLQKTLRICEWDNKSDTEKIEIIKDATNDCLKDFFQIAT